MKKSTFILFLVFVITVVANAQSDSLIFVSAKWQTEVVHPEVKWITYHFNHGELFQSNQNISVLELPAKRKKVKLSIAYSDSLELSSQLASKSHAIAGINGSYFEMRGKDPDNHPELTAVPHTSPANINRNRSQTYLKIDGKLIAENYAKSSHVKRYPRGALAFGKKDISIFKVDTTISNWEHSIRAKNIITSGPMLVSEGTENSIPDDSFCGKRHPRTAIGVRADGSVLFVVVDGRSNDANGMNLNEMQKIMRWLGCVDALNLDGGGSSTMVICEQPFHGVVNHPSDNKKFDHEGEREVANAILILEK
ncbi:phosphodiester glycosidase family protein [Maribellus luteus]|uniref:Phosphodiester glycosidase family protein n=1 Tax=Maribellus luteus TaxID=2305463 RepID=A0A399T6G2_9BACT|nr:phosphodiester glycosidase family protein [Maribellus luteus]RIJ50584.1 phosphodiester glycosidase family protein [Maribellus luteus]